MSDKQSRHRILAIRVNVAISGRDSSAITTTFKLHCGVAFIVAKKLRTNLAIRTLDGHFVISYCNGN
jgi:hypothetical protein